MNYFNLLPSAFLAVRQVGTSIVMKDKSVWLCVAFILFLLNGLPGQCSRWKQLSAWSCLPCVNGRAVFLPSKFLLQWYLLFLLSCWYVFLTGIAQHLPRMQSHLVAPYLTHSLSAKKWRSVLCVLVWQARPTSKTSVYFLQVEELLVQFKFVMLDHSLFFVPLSNAAKE